MKQKWKERDSKSTWYFNLIQMFLDCHLYIHDSILAQTNKSHQGSLIGQMGDKERVRANEYEKKKQEEEAERLRNLEYERKLAQKKLEGKQLVKHFH